MAHSELDLRERRTIEDMLNAKIPVREIAAEIGRHVSTVYRDIKRNGYTDEELPELNSYYGIVAQKAATQRRAQRRKLVRLIRLRKAVIKQLKEGCRHCYRLAYPSQREKLGNRAERRADRIRDSKGWPGGILEGGNWGNPKGMHWHTYERLCREHDALPDRALVGIMDHLGRFSGRS